MSTQFHHWITADGSSGFQAEAGRYHLYISLGCPWAHRTALLWKLKGLEEIVGLSIVDPIIIAVPAPVRYRLKAETFIQSCPMCTSC